MRIENWLIIGKWNPVAKFLYRFGCGNTLPSSYWSSYDRCALIGGGSEVCVMFAQKMIPEKSKNEYEKSKGNQPLEKKVGGFQNR